MHKILAQATSLLAAIAGVVRYIGQGTIYSDMVVQQEDMTGRNVIITGANSGIGLASAKKLVAMNANVFLACRSTEKAQKAQQEIIDETACLPERITIVELDCADLRSVKGFISAWGDKPIDVLLNNAGIISDKYRHSPQGHELIYATNILSHFYLTLGLLPCFRKHGRIVNVSSFGHLLVNQPIDPCDMDYSLALKEQKIEVDDTIHESALHMRLYSMTKLQQVYFTKELQHRLDASQNEIYRTLSVFSCMPGIVKSSIWKQDGLSKYGEGSFTMKVINRIAVTNEQGACTPVYLCVSPEVLDHKGEYYDRMQAAWSNPLADDEANRDAVWDAWAQDCGMSEVTSI